MENIRIVIRDSTGKIIAKDNRYRAYAFTSTYGVLASAFSITMVDPRDVDILPGHEILFLVNGKIEFRGIIQRRERDADKNDVSITLTGKDRGSILVENYANLFKDYKGYRPKTIIDALINQTSFYTKSKDSVIELSDSTGFSNPDDLTARNEAVLEDTQNSSTVSLPTDTTEYDSDFTGLSAIKEYKISPGDTIYSKIEDIVTTAGYEILYEEDGTLYIGDLNKKRKADDVRYSLTFKYDGIGNNILQSSFSLDDSGRYSSVQISSQSEDSSGYVNTLAVARDNTLNNTKFFAGNYNVKDDTNNVLKPSELAIQVREDQRIAGYRLMYNVPGHIAPNGSSWKINRYCDVNDEINDIHETLVIHERTFAFDSSNGTMTSIKLSKERSKQLILEE